MPASFVALIFSADTGRLRSWIVPDDDNEVAAYIPPNPGESALIITIEEYAAASDLSRLQELVNAATGKSPDTDDRYIMVDAGGNVGHALFACPACGDDAFPGYEMRPHANAPVGAFFIDGIRWFPPPALRRAIGGRRRRRARVRS
jgi:hypothetical protein